MKKPFKTKNQTLPKLKLVKPDKSRGQLDLFKEDNINRIKKMREQLNQTKE